MKIKAKKRLTKWIPQLAAASHSVVVIVNRHK